MPWKLAAIGCFSVPTWVQGTPRHGLAFYTIYVLFPEQSQHGTSRLSLIVFYCTSLLEDSRPSAASLVLRCLEFFQRDQQLRRYPASCSALFLFCPTLCIRT